MTVEELQEKAEEAAKEIAANYRSGAAGGELEAGALVVLVHKNGGYAAATSGFALARAPALLRQLATDVENDLARSGG